MLNAEVYLLRLKQSLIHEARDNYNNTEGGRKAVQEYKYAVRQIKDAPTIGDLFRVARGLNIGLGSTLRAALSIVVDVNHSDFQETPETW